MSELNVANFAPQDLTPNTPQGINQSVPEQQNQTLPTILALYALAEKGDVGPFIQLQEQKRRTQVFRALTPVITQAQQLANLGKWDEALNVTEQAFANFGSRSPEIGQFLTQLTSKLQQKQSDFVQLEATYNFLKGITPRDHVNYPIVEQFGKLVKQRTPLSQQLASNLLTRMSPEVQQFEGKTTLTSPLTGQQNVIAQPAVARIADIPDFTKRQLESKYGIPIFDIVNALNDNPVMSSTGVDVGPMLKENIKSDIAKFSQIENDIYLRSKSPTTAEYNEALADSLKAKGIAPEEVNLRMATGNFDHEDHQRARLSAQNFAVQRAVAPIRAQLLEDVFAARKAGLVSFISDPNSEKFGSPEYVTHQEFAQRGDLSYSDLRVHDRVVEAVRALSGLDYVDLMFNELGNPQATISQLSTGLRKTITALTGFPIDDPKTGSITIATAAEAIANRAMERVEQTQTISDPAIGRMKALITGKFADAQQARQAKELLKNRVRQELSIFTKQKALDPKALQEKLKDVTPEEVKKEQRKRFTLEPVR